jgi:hypothetical protein
MIDLLLQLLKSSIEQKKTNNRIFSLNLPQKTHGVNSGFTSFDTSLEGLLSLEALA